MRCLQVPDGARHLNLVAKTVAVQVPPLRRAQRASYRSRRTANRKAHTAPPPDRAGVLGQHDPPVRRPITLSTAARRDPPRLPVRPSRLILLK